jgi:hypothetical protein
MKRPEREAHLSSTGFAPAYVHRAWYLISYEQGQLYYFLLPLEIQGHLTRQFTVDGHLYL